MIVYKQRCSNPITNWCEDEFEAIIDLVEMKCFKYTNDLGTEMKKLKFLKITDRAEEARAKLNQKPLQKLATN